MSSCQDRGPQSRLSLSREMIWRIIGADTQRLTVLTNGCMYLEYRRQENIQISACFQFWRAILPKNKPLFHSPVILHVSVAALTSTYTGEKKQFDFHEVCFVFGFLHKILKLCFLLLCESLHLLAELCMCSWNLNAVIMFWSGEAHMVVSNH